MATATRRRHVPQAVTITNGPWSSTYTTDDPFDSGEDTLVDASNVYVQDTNAKSGVYARPGMDLFNNGAAVTTSATTFRGQGTINHTDLSGVTYNFVVFNGKLFRADATFSAFTDVSPIGITISALITSRVYGTSFANQLGITDGVNRPWMATNLSSTPITGTYIDFDSAGTTWAAFGPARLYGGSFIWTLSQYNSVSARTDIVWSLPGDGSTGYQQTNYDFRWTLGQTDADPITGTYGTNTQFYYWRENSIGAISGIPGPNFQTTHTDDAVSKNVGTLAPQSIIAYGTTIYFTDAIGRPYRLVPGSDPEPIWLQMRGIVQNQTVGFSGVTKTVTTAAAEATMSAYIVAIWSPIPAQQCPATEGYIYDIRTGRYFARFSIADGVQIDCLGSFIDSNGRSIMVALGSLEPPDSNVATSGYVWGIKSLEAIGDLQTTEDGVFLTTNDDVFTTTEGSETANWMDGETTPDIYIVTPRFGYDIDSVLSVDRAAVLMGGGAVTTVSAMTAAVAETVEGTPTPSSTQDDVGKLTCGFAGIQGRGVSLKVQPTTATSQFSVQQVSVNAVISRAAPDEV